MPASVWNLEPACGPAWSADSIRMNIVELRALCEKRGGDTYVTSTYFYRPVGLQLARLYIAAGFSANVATFHSLLAGLAAAACALSLSPTALLLVAGLMQLYWILDHVDGALARYWIRNGQTRKSLDGIYFDHWVHMHSINLTFACIGLGLFRQTGNLLWPVLGLVCCNICGSFQRTSLTTVLSGAFLAGELRPDDPRLNPLVGVSTGNAFAGRQATPLRRAVKLASQFFIHPGNITGITLACLGDFALHYTAWPPVLCRCAYLAAYATAGVASKIYRTATTMKQLRAITLDPIPEK